MIHIPQVTKITKDAFEEYRIYALSKNKTHRKAMIFSFFFSLIFVVFYYALREKIMAGFAPDFDYLTGWVLFPPVQAFFLKFFLVYFDLIWVILLTALCGKTVGAFFVWIIFNLMTIAASDGFAYAMLVMLAATLIANLPARRGWFKSIPKALLATLVMSLVIGLAIHTVENVIVLGIYDTVSFFKSFFGKAFPVSFFSSFLLFLYHRFMPEKIKRIFPESDFSSPKIRAVRDNIVKTRKHHVDAHIISMFITSSCLMIVAASGVAGALLDDFQTVPSDVESSMFMTKLVQVLLMEAIPWIFLTGDIISTKISAPLILMSTAILDSSEKQKNPAHESVADINSLDIEGQNEIGLLYNSLKRSEGHLQAYLKSVQEKIALEKDLVRAEAASEAKSTFLSSMSHEIRTPINAVLGLDEMILRECDDTTIRSYAQDIQSSGKSLLSIINDILDFSKIEAGKMEIIPADYDLTVMIGDLVNMIASRAENKGLTFSVNVDENMPHHLHGDEARIKQCVLNILTNAVKYTPSGSVTMNIGFERINEEGEVGLGIAFAENRSKLSSRVLPAMPSLPTPSLQVSETSEQILLKFSVVDTGIGIKAEDLTKLFSPFERIEESRNRSIEGTGLGMSIVKNLLAAMGTQLDVKSVYGKGSDFSFKVRQGVTDWEKIGNYEEARAKRAAEKSSYQESFQAPEARILVVDDTPMNLTVIKGLLKATRIQIDTAENGIAGLEKARAQSYDVIFIDHLMPKMDGIQMLSELKNSAESEKPIPPCIALTANAISGAKEMYLNAGFTDYLSKPIDSARLEAMLQELLPAEKLLHKGDAGFDESRAANTAVSTAHGTEADPLMLAIFGLDSAQALKNCGSTEVFLQAAENFYDSIEEKSARIEEFAESGDWKNYTILVHALKSSARLIGAAELSEQAKELEAAGDEAQNAIESAVSKIAEKTPGLLKNYRSYAKKLAALCGKSVSVNETSERSVISKEKLAEAYSALKEVVSVFDFDSADAIIAELDEYEIPPGYSEKFARVKKAVRDVDQASILQILS